MTDRVMSLTFPTKRTAFNMPKNFRIFFFDTDLGLTTIKLLDEFYEVDEYPCLVIEDQKYCGIRGKDEILEHVCAATNASFCAPT